MEDKVVLAAGGAGGIGAETSARLASGGARVAIADVNAGHAQAKAASIVAEESQAIGVACDIANPELCERKAQAAADRFGQLNGVVNRAGIGQPHDSISLPPADWARMVDVQLNGAFYIAQACVKRMWTAGGAEFPRRAGQLPMYYNSMPSKARHSYVDMPITPRWEFGYGPEPQRQGNRHAGKRRGARRW